MPRYRVRLQDPDGPHYRISHVTADTPEAAVAVCERIDREIGADPDQPAPGGYRAAYVIERGDPIPPVDEWDTKPPHPGGKE